MEVTNSLNKPQLIALNTLISKLRITKDDKQMMVSGFSNGRCTSSKDLYMDEAALMISHLKSMDPDEATAEKMRRKIISMAHEMHWETSPGRADMKAIDTWCRKFGYLKKSLDNYHYRELPKLVTQFEQGPYRHFIKSV